MYFVYVLRSDKDSKFYTGFSRNLKSRFDEHKRGGVSSTRDRRPLKLVYYEGCLSKDDALHREKYLKSYHGKAFLRKRIKSYLIG